MSSDFKFRNSYLWNVKDSEVEDLCTYIKDDGGIAGYFGISRQRVAAIRANRRVPKRNPNRFLDKRSEPAHVDGNNADRVAKSEAEKASEKLRAAIIRSGQSIAPELPKRRLTFEEQLALVASGRVGIIDLGPRA